MAYYMRDAPTQANSGQRLEVSDLSVSYTPSNHSSRTAFNSDKQKPIEGGGSSARARCAAGHYEYFSSQPCRRYRRAACQYFDSIHIGNPYLSGRTSSYAETFDISVYFCTTQKVSPSPSRRFPGCDRHRTKSVYQALFDIGIAICAGSRPNSQNESESPSLAPEDTLREGRICIDVGCVFACARRGICATTNRRQREGVDGES